ncbi:MAG TPA: protease modulator HflK, partial [Candidatus Baltobacteraceae bacterium]|nr:protease modulator HflK [Candidatus Baltobacteraceae bacterium]
LWRWTGKTTGGILTGRAMPSLSLFAIFALLLFLLGRFSVTIARLGDHRLLRPSSGFLLAGAYVCALTALGIAGTSLPATEPMFPRADFWLARVFCILLGLMAVEILLTLLLEIYRPRIRGKIARPLYESRVVGLLAQPESLFTTAAQTLDYQFGFKVSETWFFQLLQKNIAMLILAQLAVLFLSTSVVFIDPGEQAVLEHFGRPVEPLLTAGAHLKWPWPIDKVYRYRTDQIQTFEVGYTPDAESESEKTILWSVAHAKEVNFLVGSHPAATVQNQNENTSGMLKAPPVSMISVSIPVQFQITNIMEWAYQNAGQSNLLEDLATRDVVRFLAGADFLQVMSHTRLEAAQELQQQIQSDANKLRLGAKILFVGLEDIHPPVAVAGSFEDVVGAFQDMIAKTNTAVADAISTNTLAGAIAFTTTNLAEASRIQMATVAWAQAALFTNQIPAFEAAPSVYEQRAYFQAFADATANSRKYILLVTNTDNVLIFDLEDKISEDLLNVNVPND